jgi:hypothetical protein
MLPVGYWPEADFRGVMLKSASARVREFSRVRAHFLMSGGLYFDSSNSIC